MIRQVEGVDRGIGLDGVDQGVQAGEGRDQGWKPDRQLGVEQGHLREEIGADDSLFQFFLGIGKNGDGGDFAAGAGGGGDEDHRQSRIGDQVDTEKLGQVPLVGQQHRGHLGDIQGAAAAVADQRLNAFFPAQLRALSDHLQARVRFHPVKKSEGDIGRLKRIF